MIDLEAAKRRGAWLKFLQPGDSVRVFSGLGTQVGTVEAVENNRIWIGLEVPGGGRIRMWVWRDTGDCQSARISIEPTESVPRGCPLKPHE
jgi:hypothetical protein